MSNKDHDALSQAQVESIGIPETEPSFLPDPLQDRLLEAVIALGGELWVEREQRIRLESVLISKGLLSEGDLESHDLTDEQRAAQSKALSVLVKQLLGPLTSLPGTANSK